jgi:hypothetical protein
VAINAAIEHAIERSATFRQMVQTIQESDSIVFLTEGDCGHNEHACFTTVTAAGSSRIMWGDYRPASRRRRVGTDALNRS